MSTHYADKKFFLPLQKKQNRICGKEEHELTVAGRHPELDVVVAADRRPRLTNHVFQSHVKALVEQRADEECNL